MDGSTMREANDGVGMTQRRLIAVGVRRGGRWRVRTSLWRWLLSWGVGAS